MHVPAGQTPNGITLKLTARDTQGTPTWPVDIFITQTTRHGGREEIGMQIIFCVVVEINDIQSRHMIHLLCK